MIGAIVGIGAACNRCSLFWLWPLQIELLQIELPQIELPRVELPRVELPPSSQV